MQVPLKVQVALKVHGVAIAPRIAFIGIGSLLWLVAAQHLAAGIAVALVLEPAPFGTKAREAEGLPAEPGTFTMALALVARLRLPGTRVIGSGTSVAIEGTKSI